MSDGTTYSVRRFQDPIAFLAVAEPWLLRAEAEHNLAIGIAHQLAAGTLLSAKPVYLATVEAARGGSGSSATSDIVGCAFRTPPYKVGITRMPEGAIPTLVTDVRSVYETIPAVMGEHHIAQLFAEEWCRQAHIPTNAHAGMRHGIYELDRVIEPTHPAAGAPRVATLKDARNVAAWIQAFSDEANIHVDNAFALAEARIKQSALYLWEDPDRTVVSMAAWSGETPHGRRVGYVYTPPQHRGRGYASALVAYISQRILDDGCTLAFLYTDLSNPTSNSIYQKIGYRHICDVTDWNLIQTETR